MYEISGAELPILETSVSETGQTDETATIESIHIIR